MQQTFYLHLFFICLITLAPLLWSIEPHKFFKSEDALKSGNNPIPLGWSVIFLIATLALSVLTSAGTAWAEVGGKGLLRILPIPPLLFPIVSFLACDLIGYMAHVMKHKAPFLWSMHRIHHSEDKNNRFYVLGIHPGDVILSWTAQILAIPVLGLPLWPFLAYVACVVASFHFQHSGARFTPQVESVMRVIMPTPSLHGIHHRRSSRRVWNYGEVFIFWDRLFSSFREVPISGTVHIGKKPVRPDPRSPGLHSGPYPA